LSAYFSFLNKRVDTKTDVAELEKQRKGRWRLIKYKTMREMIDSLSNSKRILNGIQSLFALLLIKL